MSEFFRGFAYNAKGLSFFFKEKSLWKYAVVPLLLNFLLFLTFIFLATTFYDEILSLLMSPLQSVLTTEDTGWLAKLYGAVIWVVEKLFLLIFSILSLVLIVVFVFLLSSIINAPFYEMMAERVLELKGRLPEEPFSWKLLWKNTFHSIQISLGNIFLFLGVSVLLMCLSWIPLIGIAFTALQFFVAAWFFSLGICMYPLVLEKKNYRQIQTWARSRKALLIGFGVVSLIPVFGILFLLFQVVGGTLLTVENHHE